jgi:hypothetical protein
MRLIRSCGRVKETREFGDRGRNETPATKDRKKSEKTGNKMTASFVSSIVFP